MKKGTDGHDGKKKESMAKKHKMGKGEGKKAMPFGKAMGKAEAMGKG